MLNENGFHLGCRDGSTLNALGLAEALSSRGYKLTRQRLAVLDTVARSDGCLAPAAVHAMAKDVCPDIGLTTVYRTLEILEGLGAVRRVHSEQGCHSYAAAASGHRHHVICLVCNAVVEFAGCDLSAVLKAVSGQTGFRVEGHWLQLSGTCPACQQKRSEG
jgi:Fe2+ or Zn2+ uptake regulation protein